MMADISPIDINSGKWRNYTKQLLHFLKMYEEILDAYILLMKTNCKAVILADECGQPHLLLNAIVNIAAGKELTYNYGNGDPSIYPWRGRKDFYSKNLWDLFPVSWSESFENISSPELSNILNCENRLRCRQVFPLSLLAFRITCFSFSLPRAPISESKINDILLCNTYRDNQEDLRATTEAYYSRCLLNGKTSHPKERSPNFLLKHIFKKHLTPKKQHEVMPMAQLISLLTRITEADFVVDVGSGQGHLARLISYGFRIPTVCLEAQEELVKRARKFDSELEETARKQSLKLSINVSECFERPRHNVCQLYPHMKGEELRQILMKAWPEFHGEDGEYESFSLVGLHCCGDLGPTLMRLFSSSNSCKALLLVGCCFMKLSTKSKDCSGYPMSNIVESEENHHLSYTAREMACHSLESYINKLKKGTDDLKVHCYRAILEELIVQKNPALEHSGLQSVKNAHLLSFQGYAHKALARLKEVTFTSEELSSEGVHCKMADWMKVVIFYSIRLMMAPAVETLILLDRLFYFNEKTGAKCLSVPIFDPNLSPRNFAIFAWKEENSC